MRLIIRKINIINEYKFKPQGRTRTNNKLKSLMSLGPTIKPGPHWWEVRALTTAPLLLLVI